MVSRTGVAIAASFGTPLRQAAVVLSVKRFINILNVRPGPAVAWHGALI